MSSALICGVDEAGRGPLAGAVFAAAVILDPAAPIAGLKDSKQLSERRRDHLAALIRKQALAWSIAVASIEEIDTLNIHHATLLAMQRAVEGLAIAPGEVLVDGLYCPPVAYAARPIVKGDALVAEISAASILAKTARDAEMRQLDQRFPQYGFARAGPGNSDREISDSFAQPKARKGHEMEQAHGKKETAEPLGHV